MLRMRRKMIDQERIVCICNDASAKEVVGCIKRHGFETLEELVANDDCPVGDKCESCREEGYENDGFSLAMLLSLVKQGRL